MIKPMLLAVIMACTTTAHAQVSIWGPSAPAKDKPAATSPAPAPVSPYVRPLPQQATPNPAPVFPQVAPAPTPAPQVAPAPEPQKPKWSLKDVPDDPAPLVYPGRNGAPAPGDARPPVVMDKADVLKGIKDPEMRKELEKYAQGDKLVFPQNPPEMDENTAKILPSPQIPMPENDIEVPDLFDDCPTNDCPEPI